MEEVFYTVTGERSLVFTFPPWQDWFKSSIVGPLTKALCAAWTFTFK